MNLRGELDSASVSQLFSQGKKVTVVFHLTPPRVREREGETLRERDRERDREREEQRERDRETQIDRERQTLFLFFVSLLFFLGL